MRGHQRSCTHTTTLHTVSSIPAYLLRDADPEPPAVFDPEPLFSQQYDFIIYLACHVTRPAVTIGFTVVWVDINLAHCVTSPVVRARLSATVWRTSRRDVRRSLCCVRMRQERMAKQIGEDGRLSRIAAASRYATAKVRARLAEACSSPWGGRALPACGATCADAPALLHSMNKNYRKRWKI